MRALFYASFVPGFEACAEEVVRQRLTDVRIVKRLEGALLFETGCSYDRFNFFCFNNIFAVISVLEHGKTLAAESLERHIGESVGRHSAVIAFNSSRIKSFRIVMSIENTPAAASEAARRSAEAFIARESGLAVDRKAPDTEFWYLYRREGCSLFMKRLTRHASFEKTLHGGELSAPLAWFLCRLSRPRHTDVVLDPFCGYGAIPAARTRHFPLRKMYALDIDRRPLSIARAALKDKIPGVCAFYRADVFSLPAAIKDTGFDAIITDPPWGFHQVLETPAREFYGRMTGVFSRLLKPGGRLVTLTARRDEFALALQEEPRFKTEQELRVLVSGKKAAVFVVSAGESAN